MTISRRMFLGAASAALALQGDPLGKPIGTQVWPVREDLGKDFEGTLHKLAETGFRTIEMCSPAGYKGPFAPLADMKTSDMRRKIEGAGLHAISSHFQFRELKESLDDRIAFAKELGLSQMVVASFGLRQDASMDAWVQAAQDMNKIGEQVRRAGLQLGFHNHTGEFKEIDGVMIYSKLLEKFDPEMVKLQFQVGAISVGADATKYLRKYPGRYLSMHLADWNASEKKEVAVGSGVVDWKDLFAAAKTAGVRNWFVEVNPPLMASSYQYLHGLKT